MKELFIDFETTGLPQNGSFERVGVTQFSCIYRENGAVQWELDLHCRPFEGALISKEALHVTGKTIADLEAAPPEEEQFEVFRKRMEAVIDKYDKTDKAFMIGHNVKFDEAVMRAWISRSMKSSNKKYWFGSMFWWPPVCTAIVTAAKHRHSRHAFPGMNLAACCEHLELEWDETKAHDSLYDVRKAMELYDTI